LVDYTDDVDETQVKKPGGLPFWAAPDVLADKGYQNPLKKRKETLKKVEDEVRDVLGMSK